MIVDTVIYKGRKINITSYMKTVNKNSVTYYRARLTTYYDPITHKQIQKTISGASISAVREQLLQLIDPASVIPKYNGAPIKIQPALDSFIHSRYGGGNQRTMIARSVQAKLLISKLGDEYIHTTTQAQVQKAVDELSISYSPHTIHGAVSTFRLMFDQYVHRQEIPFNPCTDIRIPALPPSSGIALSYEQLRQLLNHLSGSPYYLFYYVLALTAARVGECRALTWDNIDFESKRITIDRQIPANCNDVFLYVKNNNPTKLPYCNEVFSFLKMAYDQQQEYMRMAGDAWSNPNHLVFTTSDGKPILYYRLLEDFKKATDAIGIPKFRMHDLRHTYASILWEETHRIDLVSIALKHKTALTTRRYIHPTPKTYSECQEIMNKVSQQILDMHSSSVTPPNEGTVSISEYGPVNTVRSLLFDYLNSSIENNHSNSSYFQKRSLLCRWVLPLIGDKTFDEVDESDILAIISGLREKQRSVSLSKNVLYFTRRYFIFAINTGVATKNPVGQVSRYFKNQI